MTRGRQATKKPHVTIATLSQKYLIKLAGTLAKPSDWRRLGTNTTRQLRRISVRCDDRRIKQVRMSENLHDRIDRRLSAAIV